MTATNEAALTRKVEARFVTAISRPAIAGPMMRDELMITLFRATALPRSSRPTISTAKLCRVGLSTTLMKPRTRASIHTIQS